MFFFTSVTCNYLLTDVKTEMTEVQCETQLFFFLLPTSYLALLFNAILIWRCSMIFSSLFNAFLIHTMLTELVWRITEFHKLRWTNRLHWLKTESYKYKEVYSSIKSFLRQMNLKKNLLLARTSLKLPVAHWWHLTYLMS